MQISHCSPVSADLVSFKARGPAFLISPYCSTSIFKCISCEGAHQHHAESVCIEQSLVVATSVCVGVTLVDPRAGVRTVQVQKA